MPYLRFERSHLVKGRDILILKVNGKSMMNKKICDVKDYGENDILS
jgi:hypothetical protein